jgi:hypothetical protein
MGRVKISDIKRMAKRRLEPEDYEQVAVKLDLAQRKENIRADFEKLRVRHGSVKAIKMLADKYCLAEITVDQIVYPRRK